jgi:hypothetical protein
MATSHDFLTTKKLMKQFRKVKFWRVRTLSFNDCKNLKTCGKCTLDIKCLFHFFCPKYLTFRQIFSEIEKHAKKYMPSCKVPVIAVEFETKLEYAGKFVWSLQYQNLFIRHTQCTCNVTQFGVRIMSIPPRLSDHPGTISLKESDLMTV